MRKMKREHLDGTVPFVFAAQFYREPGLPIAELKRDMRKIKDLGLNTIKIQEAWSYDEPAEGRYDFAKMDDLAGEAERVGLKVFFTVCLEVPAWAWKKYPGSEIINQEGRRLYSRNGYGYTDGKPGPCWNHPGIRKAAGRFLAAFARRLGRHRNIVMWQAYQELNWWHTSLECYCPVCFNLYRKWLKRRYGTLERLSAAWMIPCRAWDEVEPTRQRSGPSFSDWWRFCREQAGAMLKWRADALRSNDPHHRPVSVNVSGPHLGQEWEWMLADNADICGVSFYPGYFHVAPVPGLAKGRIPGRAELLPNDMWHTCLWFDSIRVAARGKPWASEFQAGAPGGAFHHGSDPAPEDMRRWLLLALSAGVKGISFWNHRPEFFGGEGHRYGIFGNDMAPSPKTREIGAIVKAVTRRGALFEPGRLADVEAAILVNDDNARLLDMHSAAGMEVKAIQGLYRTLWRMGVNADFIAPADMASGKIGGYKVIFLPFQMAISGANAELLAEYVRGGGVLVAEACPGRYSERGMANLGTGFAPGLAAALGCRDGGIRMCIEQDGTHYNKGYEPATWHDAFIAPAHLKGVGEFKGIALPASFYVETFKVTTGAPIFMHGGMAAGVRNAYGRGTAYVLGTFPSVAMMHSAKDAGLERALEIIIKRAKIRRARLGKLLLRRLVSDAGQVWFAINPSGKPVTQKLALPRGAEAWNLLGGMKVPDRITVDAFSVEALVIGGRAAASESAEEHA
ncbi:MAG: hypothetical protein GX608_12315 [Lentisphaerae bacterium]|nr:hypothetical protein [Lentisphaerota bacterium]